MTRAVRARILKDSNGDVSDQHHLRNHIHLTNCIHLKNHMHINKKSPVIADRSLVRDLVVLQRSRSLRDPSMSPPHSWKNSPLVLSKRAEIEAFEARRSVESERYRVDDKRFYGGSPLLAASAPMPKSSCGDVQRRYEGAAAVSDRANISGAAQHDDIGRRMHGNADHLMTLAEQLNEVRFESDNVASSSPHPHLHHHHHHHHHGFHAVQEKPVEGAAESGIRSSCNRAKRRKFRGTRRARPTTSREQRLRNEMSAASNSFNFRVNEEEEYVDDRNVSQGPRNGCGIPWNWSRIHNRGKTFLDIAGRSFSCGASDPKLKKAGPARPDFSNMPLSSDHSSSPGNFNAEAPLLVEAFASQGSTDNAPWVHDYSGELGIYADNLLKNEVDSDLNSEARSGDQCKVHGNQIRHENLTQKYMPRTFRDLVGQTLVAQALSNAANRRKVGSLYVFHGPHGTGKTSCARVFARALNCQSLDHQKPCGSCRSCIANERKCKNRSIIEVGPIGSFDYEGIMEVLESMIDHHSSSQYKVLIFDDCDTMSQDCWSAIAKAFDRAPKRVVFILIGLRLDVMPHTILTRCQKFFFPKLKDADIIYTLQWIASKENLEINKDALKLIASRSDGSLRDAEMTLDQLSLLGQRITVPLVQELIGLISDEKLVDLLDLALSADTVNTVRNLREIMESGIEPLALMSQLATVITDILAGSYDFMKERLRRKFFGQELSKEDMEKLRQALKILSEAEKQLRLSNDRLTWLTAALLQLAPDKQYLLPSSSAETSFRHSPRRISNAEKVRTEETPQAQASNDVYCNRNGAHNNRPGGNIQYKTTDEIWFEVLEKIHVLDVKEFMHREGKLLSVSFGAAPTVQLMLGSHLTKSNAEKFRMNILQAFESVLGSPVTIEIRYALRNEGFKHPITTSSPGPQVYMNPAFMGHLNQAQLLPFDSSGLGRDEIIELEASTDIPNGSNENTESTKTDQKQSQSLVRNKILLSNVIQQQGEEGCVQQSGWSRKKAVSIAEKLEQENMRLEPKSRSLLCWKAESRGTRRKLSRFRIRTKQRQALLKFVSCGKYAATKSPR